MEGKIEENREFIEKLHREKREKNVLLQDVK